MLNFIEASKEELLEVATIGNIIGILEDNLDHNDGSRTIQLSTSPKGVRLLRRFGSQNGREVWLGQVEEVYAVVDLPNFSYEKEYDENDEEIEQERYECPEVLEEIAEKILEEILEQIGE